MRLAGEGRGQALAIILAWDFQRAEAGEMLGDELRVQESVVPLAESGDQVHESHLAGIGRGREHAFAEEGAAEADPVETADQLAVEPGLDAMGMAHAEELAAEIEDRLVDPGLAAA